MMTVFHLPSVHTGVLDSDSCLMEQDTGLSQSRLNCHTINLRLTVFTVMRVNYLMIEVSTVTVATTTAVPFTVIV